MSENTASKLECIVEGEQEDESDLQEKTKTKKLYATLLNNKVVRQLVARTTMLETILEEDENDMIL